MNSDKQKTFGQLVREKRTQLELTQEKMAQQAGCATISARRIEAGTLRPSTQLAEQLADVLQIPAEERKAFVKLGRAVSYKNNEDKEENNAPQLPLAQGMDARMWRHTEYLLTLLPLVFLVMAMVINPRYIGELMAMEPPFLVVNLIPCGWLVFVLVFALMVSSKFVLQNGRRATGKRQVYYRTGINGFVLLFLTFPALLLLLLAPALFQLLRSDLLAP